MCLELVLKNSLGNVGGELAHKLERLGFDVRLCDPPRADREEDDQEFVSLEEAMKCDVVSLHTPLTREGDHPTLHMIGHPAQS